MNSRTRTTIKCFYQKEMIFEPVVNTKPTPHIIITKYVLILGYIYSYATHVEIIQEIKTRYVCLRMMG